LKPLQSWQVVPFSPYEFQEIQLKNPFHLILSLGFNLGFWKMNLITLKKLKICKGLSKELKQ
jgi:hypothetical protein